MSDRSSGRSPGPDDLGTHDDEVDSSPQSEATGFWEPDERRKPGGSPRIARPWGEESMSAAPAYPPADPPPPGDDGFEGTPTRIAFTPDDAPTTQLDLSKIDLPDAPEDLRFPPLADAAPEALPPEPFPPPEPYAADEYYAEPPQVEEYRGWGPQVPDEMVKTKFFDRAGADEHANPWAEPAIDTAPSLKKPPEEKPEPEPPRVITGTYVVPKGSVGNKRGRALIIGALCVAGGVVIGTAVGLTANSNDGDDAVPSTATASVAAAPEVAPEPAVEPVVAPAPEPVVAPAPEPVAEAPAEATGEPTPEEPTPEAAAEAEPPAPLLDPLEEAGLAIRDGNAEDAAEALARARTAAADPAAIARLDAELAVLRGDGALAVSRIEDTARAQREAPLYVALGRLLVQAERDREATRAFETALELDPNEVDAHLGMSGIQARAAQIGNARQSHRQAVEAAGDRAHDDAILGARIRAAEALIMLENGEVSSALREAEAALRLDARSAEAALLQARIARLRNQPADVHLRHAVSGRAPAPMAIALLAQAVEGEERCELASRYLERAPRGFDATAMRRIDRDCD